MKYRLLGPISFNPKKFPVMQMLLVQGSYLEDYCGEEINRKHRRWERCGLVVEARIYPPFSRSYLADHWQLD